jgi:GNAT superfamily N-acetyltransferase
MISVQAAPHIRPYGHRDEAQVLDLLSASLGGGPLGRRPAEFFRWKHLENPFGSSFLLVGEAEGRIVGLRAFLRWRFRAGHRTIRAVRAVDTATHPSFQGRGMFRALTTAALEVLAGEADLIFNTPNEKSLPGYLKMGWRLVGRLPVLLRPKRPLRVAAAATGRRMAKGSGHVHALTAAEALADEKALRVLLDRAETGGNRLRTAREPEYLHWRYADAPLLDYRAVTAGDEGLAIFRVRPRSGLLEATISELLVPVDDVSGARALLREVSRIAPVDHLTCAFPHGSTVARASRWSGFLPAPRRITLVARTLGDDLGFDLFDRRSWALSLGDLEVF